MTGTPWLAGWNYRVLHALFRALPHSSSTDTLFQFWFFDHLASGWVFAAAFFIIWNLDDGLTRWRRVKLLQMVVAFAIALAISLLVRPWVAWPAPARNPQFLDLYPRYLWGNGSSNSFPSHSTLAYFTVAAGLWPISRRASGLLSLFVLAAISIPRIYLGGHYPIDVIFSLVLVLLVLPLTWRWPVPATVADWLHRPAKRIGLREVLLFLWLFELGESFRGLTNILGHFTHALR